MQLASAYEAGEKAVPAFHCRCFVVRCCCLDLAVARTDLTILQQTNVHAHSPTCVQTKTCMHDLSHALSLYFFLWFFVGTSGKCAIPQRPTACLIPAFGVSGSQFPSLLHLCSAVSGAVRMGAYKTRCLLRIQRNEVHCVATGFQSTAVFSPII